MYIGLHVKYLKFLRGSNVCRILGHKFEKQVSWKPFVGTRVTFSEEIMDRQRDRQT